MKIKEVTTQLRNDLYGTMECEHCGHVQKFVGYDDANYHANVVPAIKCKACGKDAAYQDPDALRWRGFEMT